MCLYPLGLFITWFPIIFSRILRYYDIDSQFMVQVGFVMDNMNGLLNAVSLNENEDDSQFQSKKLEEEDIARTDSKLIMISY
ncbi:hypothetical protein TTHERM_00136170 (macronuclear) [Tetrahymena thermophila SB210]|uniref:Uncharacterized protein n=1 Tax=Tetrahymena thermophila (strain SB210) TaxID=312017 RepID=I7M8Q2_TETTS|nr:hypothetical protein TTHERM_00136170 [Tetrahymena thermophila SB210]EAR99453.2 hypothetical protein TTHERM_00136170 [Tetrahymena thermophila SB210]|eukprot:XP_001019698.2 hypothetical protein TTHERM_00136170 [Tetrahymena thermophila SB210]